MNDLVEIILSSRPDKQLLLQAEAAKKNYIDMFREYVYLANYTPIEYLCKFDAFGRLGLDDFLELGIVAIDQCKAPYGSLIDYCIEKGKIKFVRMLISKGAHLSAESLNKAAAFPDILRLLTYKPGPNTKNLFEICTKRLINQNVVHNLLLDYDLTTDDSDSEAEDRPACDPIILKPGERLAFRGTHFSNQYYTKPARNKIKQQAQDKVKQSTYSQSTLFDAGYSADDDVDENDSRITAMQQEHQRIINTLQTSADKKEKKIGSVQPNTSRNKIQFQSHFYRFIQVYINSYSHLFNHGAIEIDFGFRSRNNPLISMSWDCEKASLYGLGNRFDQGQRNIYRNPHYRHSTHKPKHPNAGYVDIFLFDEEYIRQSTVDRKKLFDDGLIFLNCLYKYEEEVIAFSVIPKKYHQQRCILSLPRLDGDFKSNKSYYQAYGIKSQKTLTHLKELLFNKTAHQAEYNQGLKKLAQHSAEAQSAQITSCLFPTPRL